MRRVVVVVILGLTLVACGGHDDTVPADTQALLPGAGETVGGDTAMSATPEDTTVPARSAVSKSRGGAASPAKPQPAADSAPPPAPRPREGMRPEARDTKPWQVPPPDSGKTPN